MAFSLLHEVPIEVQHNILRMLNRDSLANLCRASKRWSAIATPFLWDSIDFVSLKEGDEDGNCLEYDELIIMQSAFFWACNRIMDTNQERWKELAYLVRSLRMVRVCGCAIPAEIPKTEDYSWVYHTFTEPGVRGIFDVIACFENLREFHFYMKEPLDIGTLSGKRIANLKGAFPNLRTLEVGGEIGKDLVVCLLSRPENIEQLTCAGLRDGTVGQEDFSAGVVFLSDMAHRFTRLKKLHLTKLALRTEMPYSPEGYNMWSWDPTLDIQLLRDWAELLTHVAPALEVLTLGNFYVKHGEDHDAAAAKQSELEDLGGEYLGWFEQAIPSNRRFRDIILPALANQPWPKLDWLTFTGIALTRKMLEEAGVWKQLIASPQVDIMQGETVDHQYDSTPLCISPPSGSFQAHGTDYYGPFKTISERTHRRILIAWEDNEEDGSVEGEGEGNDNERGDRIEEGHENEAER